MNGVCLWCGEPATLLCDRPLGHEPRPDGLVHMDGEHFSCDAEICVGCATRVGMICGEEPDTIDLCPVHASGGMAMRPGWWDGAAKTPEEAESMRREVEAKARRSRLRVVLQEKP